MVRIIVDDWEHAERETWVKAIDDRATRERGSLVVVTYSLGCLAFVHWACLRGAKIRGALLVAVPDPHGLGFPPDAEGFAPVPLLKLPYPSIVVSSDNDPYGTAVYAHACATAWGSTFVNIGAAGHINGADLGDWPFGFELLKTLRGDEAS